jgi:hypothetical protein
MEGLVPMLRGDLRRAERVLGVSVTTGSNLRAGAWIETEVEDGGEMVEEEEVGIRPPSAPLQIRSQGMRCICTWMRCNVPIVYLYTLGIPQTSRLDVHNDTTQILVLA